MAPTFVCLVVKKDFKLFPPVLKYIIHGSVNCIPMW